MIYYGLDALGLPKYADLIVREMPDNFALGTFATTFGDALPAIDKVLQTGRVPLVRAHFLWSDSHTFGDRDIPVITKLARRYQKLKERYPSVVVECSPFCEHCLRNPDKYLDIVQHEAPDCVPVNTIWRGAISRKYKNEVHGGTRKPGGLYNYSFDGDDAPNANVEAMKAAHSGADVFFLWGTRFNGTFSGKPGVPRPQRTGWPDSRYIDSIIALSRDKGATSLPKRWLYKSHAENKGIGDPRAEKPVWVVPIKTKAIELRTRNGQVVDRAKWYGGFPDNRWRYYATQMGFLIADKARRIQGDELCEVWADGKKYGVVNPIFREGDYRA